VVFRYLREVEELGCCKLMSIWKYGAKSEVIFTTYILTSVSKEYSNYLSYLSIYLLSIE
jgi:hypothetical protein